MGQNVASFVLAVALVGGCSHALTTYVPVGVRTADRVFAATPYALNGDPTKGTIQVLSLDGQRLPVGPGAPEMYLHVRLVGDNLGDDATWLLDPNDQMLSYGGGMVSPAFSKTSAAHPVLSLGKGTRGWLDLYYPLPLEYDPLEVTLWWRVRRGAAAFTQTTSFLRVTGRDLYQEDREEHARPYESALMPSSLALGWWWPDYCFQGGGQGGHGGGRRYRSSRSDGSNTSHGDSGSAMESPSRSSWSSSSSSSDSASNWRNPSASSEPSGASGGGASAGDAEKSGWRGGGRR